jgi:Cof subfamily protein (haloacid dehalogenase superfamily)
MGWHKMIKLAAFDVDGTLRERDYLPDSTKVALHKLKEQGVELALCTGRSEHEMASLREELGIDWAITCNGSHVGYRGKTVFGNKFEPGTVSRWLQEADRMNHTVLLYGSERMFMNQSADAPYFRQAQQEIGFMEPDVLDVQRLNEGTVPDVYQCIVFCGDQDEQAYLGEMKDAFYKHRWRTWALDINPVGMNKAVGLRKLLDHLGIAPEEAAAFGDGLNDMEMIGCVGMGIAMGNAIDELKARARYVTKPMYEDGIAYAVDTFLLEDKEG